MDTGQPQASIGEGGREGGVSIDTIEGPGHYIYRSVAIRLHSVMVSEVSDPLLASSKASSPGSKLPLLQYATGIPLCGH